MVETIPTQQTESMHAQVGSPLYLPNAASTAQHIWTQALEFCARKMTLEGADQVIAQLGQCDSAAHAYCLYSVAKQTAAVLADLDKEIKAIYILDYDATPHDLCFSQANTNASPIHLIVWVQRKTAALEALIASLDGALTQAYNDTLDTHTNASLLDVQAIDDAQVEHRVGYGALLSSIHHRPIQIWSSPSSSGRPS
jgi:hypothetical protein